MYNTLARINGAMCAGPITKRVRKTEVLSIYLLKQFHVGKPNCKIKSFRLAISMTHEEVNGTLIGAASVGVVFPTGGLTLQPQH